MISNRHSFGKSGEELVLQWYENHGFIIIQKNFQHYRKGVQGRLGEIDLIVSKVNKVHIVEVKSRNNYSFGKALDQISPKQILCLHRAYKFFLLKNSYWSTFPAQLDIATFQDGELAIISNAYQFDYSSQ